MKAWQVQRHDGGLGGLVKVDVPHPEPKPSEVRIRVEAVGINHLDLWVKKGVPGHRFPLPLIPGCDVTGTIDRMGTTAQDLLARENLAIGSPIIVNPGISCGRCEACLGGFDPLCRSYGILGETRDGGCAEFVIVPATNVIRRHPSLTPTDAAAIPIPYLTAWTMLVRKARIGPGDLVLIQAGGSSVSIASIQIAKLFGATVVTTVGSDEKATRAKSLLGADYVIQYKATPFRDEVKKISAKERKAGCDIVVDHVGTESFLDSLKCLAPGGKLVTCGATTGAKVEIDLKPLFFKNISILGTTMGSKADLLGILRLVEAGKLKPVIDSVLSMEDLPYALERLENRSVFGKIVLTR